MTVGSLPTSRERSAMNLFEMCTRLERLGLVTAVEDLDGVAMVTVAKPVDVAGNRSMRAIEAWPGPGHEGTLIETALPFIRVFPDEILFEFGGRPGGERAYWTRLQSLEALYNEVVRFFFDPDSPMSLEDGFIAGPGRQPEA